MKYTRTVDSFEKWGSLVGAFSAILITGRFSPANGILSQGVLVGGLSALALLAGSAATILFTKKALSGIPSAKEKELAVRCYLASKGINLESVESEDLRKVVDTLYSRLEAAEGLGQNLDYQKVAHLLPLNVQAALSGENAQVDDGRSSEVVDPAWEGLGLTDEEKATIESEPFEKNTFLEEPPGHRGGYGGVATNETDKDIRVFETHLEPGGNVSGRGPSLS